MLKLTESLLRVSTDGKPEQIPVTPGSVTYALLADLLHTDVTERLRVSRMPELPDAGDAVLCFVIDARGGDRSLPANTTGTCHRARRSRGSSSPDLMQSSMRSSLHGCKRILLRFCTNN